MSIVVLSSALSKRYEPPKIKKKFLHIVRNTIKTLKREGGRGRTVGGDEKSIEI